MGSNGWRPHSAIGGYGAVLRYQGLARNEGPRFGWHYSRRQASTGPPASLKAAEPSRSWLSWQGAFEPRVGEEEPLLKGASTIATH
jgi:hypothetical protein